MVDRLVGIYSSPSPLLSNVDEIITRDVSPHYGVVAE